MRIILLFFYLFYSNYSFAQNNFETFDFFQRQKIEKEAISISECLALLKAEEEKYPIEEQYNTKLMVTRFRKMYYDFPNWDNHLIKGVKDIKPTFSTTKIEKIKGSERFVKSRFGYKIRLVDLISYPVDEKGSILPFRKDILNTQEVKLNDSILLDIGHVFCGLDAHNHPNRVVPPRVLGLKVVRWKLSSNQNAVLWLGDMGSLVAESYLNQRTTEKNELNNFLNIYIPMADMEGNLDAYSIIKVNELKNGKEQKVSDILEHFYENQYKTCNKYRIFLEALGFFEKMPTTEKEKLYKQYTQEVNDAAAMYLAAAAKNTGKKINIIKVFPLIMDVRKKSSAKPLMIRFFQQLEKLAYTN